MYFQGFVETRDGVESIDVERDGAYVNVWVGGNLADDVEVFEDLLSEYGSMFYYTLDDYKADRTVPHLDVWPDFDS